MAPRAIWKGHLRVAELTCPVALHAASSSSDRVAFHTINRATGHRVRREFVDSETGRPVPREDQAKGFEAAPGDFVMLDPDEVAGAVPDSDKTLTVDSFVACGSVDDVYFDKPYFLAPADAAGSEAFALVRDGLRAKQVVAIARTVLFRRVRSVLIRAQGRGLIATTLNYDHEVRPAASVFADIPDIRIEGEMLDLAKHIIATKSGRFDPKAFDDRYDAALADLVKAKLDGRKPRRAAAPKRTEPSDLLAALRKSAGRDGARSAAPRQRKTSAR